MSICWIKLRLLSEKVIDKLVFNVDSLSESKQKPKTNSASHLRVYISETKRSILDINILLHPFSCTRLPTNEICAWLPCYRFQRGPNLPLEIRQLPVCPVFPSSLLLVCSPAPAATHLHVSGHVLQHHALGTLLRTGFRGGGEILLGKWLNKANEVNRND